jgi:hypothetical protein
MRAVTSAHPSSLKSPAEEQRLATRRVPVLYIGGYSRSGSTLLERILGEVSGLFPAGELVHLWQRGLVNNELCSCEAPFLDCPFWIDVGERAFGGWNRLDPDAVVSLKRGVDRHRYIPLMLAPYRPRAYEERIQAMSGYLERLYRAIHEATNRAVIIDSSKNISYAFLLRHVLALDVRVLHLVRDSRAVAFSLTREVRRPESVRGETHMPIYHPVRSSTEWAVDNALFHLFASGGTPYRRMLYERLIEDPRGALASVRELVRLPIDDAVLDSADPGYVEFRASHSVSGNPIRFKRGRVPLALDDEWRHAMSRANRTLVSTMTFPLLLRYGYERLGIR